MAKLPSRIRLIILAVLLLLVVIEVGLFAIAYFRARNIPNPTDAQVTLPPSMSPFLPKPAPTPTPSPGVAAAPTPGPPRSAEEEVGELQGVLRGFRETIGSNPVGNNSEITRALLGDNPRNAAFLEKSEFKFNDQGELIDRWGHPYFFHAITGKFMEVRSAGPDGAMFTADDIVGE